MSPATLTRSASEHATVEQLSAHLDRELTAEEARRLELHLADCTRCQRRLDGLRRTTAELQRLPKLEPPTELEHQVARRIALDGRRTPWSDRLETVFSGFERQSSFFAMFAVVLALAVIAVLFAQAVHRWQNEATMIPVILSAEGPDGEVRFYHDIGERRLYKVEGGWIEAGVERDAVDRTLIRDSAAASAFFLERPQLRELSELPGSVIFTTDGEVVELRSE